jgi:hypothetical protein
MAGRNQIEAPLGVKPEMHKKAGLNGLKVTGFATGVRSVNLDRTDDCHSSAHTDSDYACCGSAKGGSCW